MQRQMLLLRCSPHFVYKTDLSHIVFHVYLNYNEFNTKIPYSGTHIPHACVYYIYSIKHPPVSRSLMSVNALVDKLQNAINDMRMIAYSLLTVSHASLLLYICSIDSIT